MSYLSTEAITEQFAHDERACGNGEHQALQRLMRKHKANSLSQRRKLRAKGDCCTTGGLAGDDEVELTAARHDMRTSLHDVAEYPSFGASTGRSSYDVLKALDQLSVASLRHEISRRLLIEFTTAQYNF